MLVEAMGTLPGRYPRDDCREARYRSVFSIAAVAATVTSSCAGRRQRTRVAIM
jgi:hypothetical protein